MVAEQYPWPAIDGYRRRMDHVVRGLARVGEVDVVALHRPGTADPVDPGIPAVDAIPVPVGGDAGIRQWLPKWLTSRAPRRVLGPDWSAMSERLTALRAEGRSYDLVWFSHVDSWWAVATDVHAQAAVVDFDNLENIAMRLRRRVPPRVLPGSSPVARVRTVLRWISSRLFDLVDERRWDRLQRTCAAEVDVVTVCSDLDVVRSGCDNARVIGNGSQRPDVVHDDRTVLRSGVPTMLFVGALDYEPNTEAVEWFVSQVLDRIRQREPSAVVRIVGRGESAVSWVAEVPGVELVGAVDRVEPELESADVSIVPIRVGAGTRLKVVEALANHIPMVTTTVGSEGIDVVDGRHVLVADEAGTFADACVRLLRDGALRQVLTDNGAKLFAANYDWDIIEDELAAMVAGIIGGG